MPVINEPNYAKIQEKTIRCLHAWLPGATEEDEKHALDHLKRIWPDVHWTNVKCMIAARKSAAQWAIDMSGKKPVEEKKVPKKRGRPPKSKLTESLETVTPGVETAFVDDSIKIE